MLSPIALMYNRDQSVKSRLHPSLDESCFFVTDLEILDDR